MNETQNTPELRFEGFSEPWGQRKVADVANRFDNLRVPVTASLRVPGTTPYYGANGIQDYVEGSTHDGEFVLVAEDGANDLKNYPVRFVNGRIWVNNHAHVLQAKSEIADNKYLAYSISQVNIESILVGGGRAKLNAEALMGINFYLPTFAEQKAIGDYFAAFDSLITLHQCKHERLQHLKQALLRKMFPKPGEQVPELRFEGFTEPWKRQKLGDISDIRTGSSDVQDAVEGGRYPFFIRSDEVIRSNKYVFDCEAILTPGEGRIGEVFHYCNGKFDCHQRVYKISDFKNVEAKFVLYDLQHSFKKHAMRNTVKATVDSLRLPTLMGFELVSPKSVEEQRQIASLFWHLDGLIALHQRKCERLRRLKQALLRKMFV